MNSRSAIAVLLFGILLSNLSIAQQSREKFGMNRVQYKDFDWQYYATENFDIYYYKGGNEYATLATKYLEDEFDRITDIIGYSPYTKTKVFLYNSISDLHQSNIGLSDNNFNVGGQTDFIKSQVEIAHPGTSVGFKKELVLQISRLLINDMMFGGSLTDMFQNAYLLNLHEWFIEGAANYLATGWSMEMDDFARGLVSSKRVKKITKLTGRDASLVGQSIWNFIVEKYGRSNISNILNLTRIIRNEEKSIANTLGLPFKQLIYEWQVFYSDMATITKRDYKTASDSSKIFSQNRRELKFNHVKISPDGNKLAYVENNNGKYFVRIYDRESKSIEKVMSGGYQVINQIIDYDLPLISWSDDKTLGIINIVNGTNVLWLYDLVTNRKIPSLLEKFDQVESFDFSSNGRLAILSADVNGQNDLYLLSVRRNRVRRLTNDNYDDVNPYFIPNTNIIAFNSNRVNDTLITRKVDYQDITNNFNIYYFNLDTTKNILSKITNTISQDINAIPGDMYNVYYLSDQKGIMNLFSYSLLDSIYSQVSNFSSSIKSFDINTTYNDLAFIMQDDGKDFIYFIPDYSFEQSVFTPQSVRQEYLISKILSQKRQGGLESNSEPINITIDKTDEDNTEDDNDDNIIDTDDYVFDKEVAAKTNTNTESFLSQYRRLQLKKSISGPFPYETRFSADNLVTSWVIDPLKGFGILVETQMNDLLENQRFNGGIMATTDLKSGDLFVEYQYLKGLVDYGFRFDREVLFWEVNNESLPGIQQKYTKNVFKLSTALPLDIKSRISIEPFFTNTQSLRVGSDSIRRGFPFPQKIINNYLGFKAGYVFDNSIVTGMNLVEGTRAKINLTHHEGLGDRNNSFTNISADIRHYQKFNREMIFAVRGFYGRFFGKDPQKYLLGGMDNWIINSTNREGSGNPLAMNMDLKEPDLLFVEYVTSLRGFDYATLFGTNVILFNAEFRFPVVKYFYRGPVSSNFFRNLQFVGFYDVGSAWTHNSPFSKDPDISSLIIDNPQSAFRAEIKNFKNPWLQSYGVGMRTVMLGFYMKFDVAWPIEDYNTNPARLHVTLGYDF